MSSDERRQRAEQADRLCASALAAALGDRPETGVALVAVGGYGREDLAPYSDLDVVLVHDEQVSEADVAQVAGQVWYPLWDSGRPLDHSVRALADVTAAARADVRVALGLLDARHVAGDTATTLRLRADVLSGWRRDARRNLPLLREAVRERVARNGELAHVSVPDLKESAGGLRDATILKALVATWLVDVPHVDLERCRTRLLDLRDLLHDAAGRGTDRLTPELWGQLAPGLGVDDALQAQQVVRRLGRRMTHLSRISWRRVDRVLDPPPGARQGRAPRLERVAPGVAVSAGEVVLDRGAAPGHDPHLLLRCAVVAAEGNLPLAPASIARLVREATPAPQPWSEEGRELLTRLLASGPGLVAVWETLDEVGALPLLLPEWDRIRLLPHASVVHRFTVDRHVVETCVEASALIRRVSRPDLLLVAALLHDIGKGGAGDHSEAGEPIARAVARRWGFSEPDVEVVATLVRHHLLLAHLATTRDLNDPATPAEVAAALGSRQLVDLLEALTEADARATSAQAWTSWRAGLVRELARGVRRAFAGEVPERRDAPPRGQGARVEVTSTPAGVVVQVREPDRVGQLADIAAAMSALRLPVHSARAGVDDGVTESSWLLDRDEVEPTGLQRAVAAALDGDLPRRTTDPRTPGGLPPEVTVADASSDATVIEVRAQDRPGTLHTVLRTLSDQGVSVRSAHVGTVGPQVVDVFYVQDGEGAPLSAAATEAAVTAVRRALAPAATLDA